jgi:hypothetical protein
MTRANESRRDPADVSDLESGVPPVSPVLADPAAAAPAGRDAVATARGLACSGRARVPEPPAAAWRRVPVPGVAHHRGVYLDLDTERTRAVLLGPIWRDGVDVWRDIDAIRRLPAARRLLDAGADPHDLSVALRAAALDAAFAALARVDAGQEPAADPAEPAEPGWRLLRTGPDGTPTGEPVTDLHSELLALDPSGNAGVDLRR